MPTPVKLITWGTEYSEMLAEMGILEGEQSRFIRLLIDEAYRRFRAGNPVSDETKRTSPGDTGFVGGGVVGHANRQHNSMASIRRTGKSRNYANQARILTAKLRQAGKSRHNLTRSRNRENKTQGVMSQP